MSGASVSSTGAVSGSLVTSSRRRRLRLLGAAAERVRNASPGGQFAQLFEQRIGTSPHMQDHRQPVFARQLELLPVEKRLPLAHDRLAQGRYKKIESDFAHRHQPGIVAVFGECGIQRGQVAVCRLGNKHRVNAQRIRIAHAMGQLAHGIEVAALHGGDDAQAHTQFHSVGAQAQGKRVIRAELRGIEVAMGVDPHRLAHGHDRLR
jgi:hypothetical protein